MGKEKEREKLKFSEFGLWRFPDFFVALIFRKSRFLVRERVRLEVLLREARGCDNIASDILRGRPIPALILVIVSLGVPLVIASLFMGILPIVSEVIFFVVCFYVPLKASLFLVSLVELEISALIISRNVRRGDFQKRYFFDVYGKARLPLALASLVLSIWVYSSGLIADAVYG